MIIDFHVHAFHAKVAEKAVSAIELESGVKPYTRGLVGQLVYRMDEWGIDRACLLSVATKPSQQRVINDWAAGLGNDRIIPFGTLYPTAEDVFEEAERIKKLGLYGIKLHPDDQRFMIDEPSLDGFYSFLEELGLPVIFHAGWDCSSPDLIHCPPERAVKMIKRHPKMKMIFAHLGGNDLWQQVYDVLAGIDGEIYFDTSYTAKCPDGLMTDIIRKHGAERILFGSDCPWESGAKMAEKLLRTGLTNGERELIMGKNAERLLGLRAAN